MQSDSFFSTENEDQLDTNSPDASELRAEIGDWQKWIRSTNLAEVRPLRKILTKNCLFWGMPTSHVIHQPVTARLLQLKPKPAKDDALYDYADAATQWSERVSDVNDSNLVPTLIEALAWAHSLPSLACRFTEDAWTDLLGTLIGWVSEPISDRAIGRFIAEVELPLTLSYVLPRLRSCKSLRKPSRARFTELLDELLDGEGTPHAAYLRDTHYLFASCTRTLAIDAESKKSPINKTGRSQFDWLTRQTLRWSRTNGSCILQESIDSPHFDELMKCAMRFGDDESDVTAYKLMRGKRVPKSDMTALHCSSDQSEWSEAVSMRTDWSAKSARLAAKYADCAFSLELGVGPETILSGQSELRVVVDDELLMQESEWTDVCWESDRDLDYLELECHLSQGWQLQRQLLLAREDRFALIADAIMGPQQADIQYQHTLPLVDGIELEQSEENTEAVLLGEKRIGHVIPLALPEWRSQSHDGRLRTEPFRLEQSARASAMYAPLFICLDPQRRNQPLTWRHLTVAEDMLKVSRETAVAYRIQVGKQQWVIYRSLATPGNRTFLGQNLISDFYVARFAADDKTRMLLDVEPS